MDLSIVEQRRFLRKRGVAEWNSLRAKFPQFVPCLSGGLWEWANFRGARLRGVNLSGASLTQIDFAHADLREADLGGASLQRSHFNNANLSQANLKGANLTDCNLNGAILKYADLTRAVLVNVAVANENGASTTDLTNATIDETRFTSEEESKAGSGILELTLIDTLDKANFVRPSDLHDYLERAFKYAHRATSPEKNRYPSLVQESLDKIKALRRIVRYDDAPGQLVAVIDLISNELIAYLKKHPKELHNIRPRQFEELIAEILFKKGWEIQLTPETRDGGYDIYAISNSTLGQRQRWLIECKKNAPENKVGIAVVRALYGARTLIGLEDSRLMLATTSVFTRGVEHMANSRYDLFLRDHDDVLNWIHEYNSA